MADGDTRRHSNLWHATAGLPVAAPALDGDVATDVVIVGGGFTGCSAALHLAEAGASVRLVEAQEIGHGGSGRNVGLVNAGLWLAPDDVEAALGTGAGARLNAILADGPRTVFDLIEKHGIDCEATRTGTLHCAHSQAGLKTLRSRFDQLASRGAPVEMLPAAATATATGARGFHGALLDRRAGTIQPLAYARGLARAAREAGADLHEHSPVLTLARETGGWRVRTPGGSVLASVLIVATNAYHAFLALDPAEQFVPVHYFQFATEPLEPAALASILPGRQGCWDTATVMSSFRRDAAGRLIVGGIGSLEAAGASIHHDWASRKLGKLFPQLGRRAFAHGWCGRIAMMSDHIPKVVSLGPRAVCISGYSGRGIAPGTVFGRACAAFAAGEGEAAFPVPVTPPGRERFRTLKGAWYEAGATAFHLMAARG